MATFSRRDFLRISVVGVAGAGMGINGYADTPRFTIATINDTHIKDEPSLAILNEAIDSINSNTDIQFTCVLGDIATDGRKEELVLAKTALEKLNKPYFAVPGNHDVFLRDEDIYKNYTSTFGDSHWIHEKNDWTFIGFNSCEGVKSDVIVSPVELAWLQNSLKGVDVEKPIALFCHHPLNPHSKAYRIKNADDILGLFSGHNLQLIAAGHWHGNQMEEQDDATFTTTACCSSTRGNFDKTPEKGYRLFHLEAEKVGTEFVVVRSE